MGMVKKKRKTITKKEFMNRVYELDDVGRKTLLVGMGVILKEQVEYISEVQEAIIKDYIMRHEILRLLVEYSDKPFQN